MSLFHLASGDKKKENYRLKSEIKQLKFERDTAIFIARDRLDRLNKANNIINELEEFKEEHKIMKQILIENNLWETLLNDDRFLEHLRK